MPQKEHHPDKRDAEQERLYALRNVKHTEPYMQNRKIQEMIHRAEDVMENNHFEG